MKEKIKKISINEVSREGHIYYIDPSDQTPQMNRGFKFQYILFSHMKNSDDLVFFQE